MSHSNTIIHSLDSTGTERVPIKSTDNQLLVKANDLETKIDKLNNKMVHSHIKTKIKLSSTTATTVYADSTPIPYNDENDRPGWLYKKTISNTDKFNLYFYSEGNTPMTIGDLSSLSSILTIDNYQNFSSLPFFVVYTKMTGVADAGAFYHSKRTYSLSTGGNIHIGESVEIYSLLKPVSYEGHRQIEFNNTTDTGTVEDSQEIYFMSLHSDSSGLLGTQMLINQMGYTAYNNTINNRFDLVN